MAARRRRDRFREALVHHQRSSEAIRGHQRPSGAICGTKRHSEAIGGAISEALGGNGVTFKWHSEAI